MKASGLTADGSWISPSGCWSSSDNHFCSLQGRLAWHRALRDAAVQVVSVGVLGAELRFSGKAYDLWVSHDGVAVLRSDCGRVDVTLAAHTDFAAHAGSRYRDPGDILRELLARVARTAA